MSVFAVSSLVLAGALAFAPPTGPGAKPGAAAHEPDPRERRQFALLGAGTATGVVGLGGLVIGLIGLDLRYYEICDVPDDPTKPVLEPQTRCFEEGEYARRHRNANTMMIAGLTGGGAALLASAALITTGLVIRRRRMHANRISLVPTMGRTWGLQASLRF